MKTEISIKETRQPKLTRAVLRSVERESLEDVCRNGASGGYGNFIYHKETSAFFKRNKTEIMSRIVEDSAEYGTEPFAMIAGFVCLRELNLNAWQVSEAINGKGDDSINVQTALAWYALEEIARELNPEL